MVRVGWVLWVRAERIGWIMVRGIGWIWVASLGGTSIWIGKPLGGGGDETFLLFFPLAGNFPSFMQKEIFEQPESVMNTMRGRVNFDENRVILGGIKDYMAEIRRCRRLLFIGCGTSYHSAVAVRVSLFATTLLAPVGPLLWVAKA